MVYVTGDIPVGDYDPDRLANIGIGHAAIDAGYGYTYFDTKTGHEFSAVLGLTYNFENPDTDYKNGIDAHLDYGISQFLSQNLQVGAVGYLYQQVTGDSGSGDRVGSFESRVAGIGPQFGYLFPCRKDAGLREPQGILRVRRREPAGRLERLADPLLLASRPVGVARQSSALGAESRHVVRRDWPRTLISTQPRYGATSKAALTLLFGSWRRR